MRPRYSTSTLLLARDLNDEHDDLWQRLRRHDRFMHGVGVVCGLRVYAAPDRLHPWIIGVCPGYAIGPCGDEIEVPSPRLVNIWDFLWSRPYVNGVGSREVAVGLRFADCAGTAMNSSSRCGCSSTLQQSPSARICDGYAVEILWTSGRTSVPEIDICQRGPIPCPGTPVSLHVILALVRLPILENTPLTNADIIQGE